MYAIHMSFKTRGRESYDLEMEICLQYPVKFSNVDFLNLLSRQFCTLTFGRESSTLHREVAGRLLHMYELQNTKWQIKRCPRLGKIYNSSKYEITSYFTPCLTLVQASAHVLSLYSGLHFSFPPSLSVYNTVVTVPDKIHLLVIHRLFFYKGV